MRGETLIVTFQIAVTVHHVYHDAPILPEAKNKLLEQPKEGEEIVPDESGTWKRKS